MIVIMKPMTEQTEIDKLAESLTAQGVEVNPVYGTDLTILGLVGDTSKIDPSRIEANRNVERVVHVAEPFKKANRMFHQMCIRDRYQPFRIAVFDYDRRDVITGRYAVEVCGDEEIEKRGRYA